MSMLLLPVVRLIPALAPSAILPLPAVLLKSANAPMALFSVPISLLTSASVPIATFEPPVVLNKSAAAPTAVLESPLLSASAPPPILVLKLPSIFENSERQPSAVFPAPVVLLIRASSPRNALKRLESQTRWQTARACGERAKQPTASGMSSKASRKGVRFIESFGGIIVVFIRAEHCKNLAFLSRHIAESGACDWCRDFLPCK